VLHVVGMVGLFPEMFERRVDDRRVWVVSSGADFLDIKRRLLTHLLYEVIIKIE